MTGPMDVLRGVIEAFETKVAAGNEDPAEIQLTVNRILACVLAHGMPPRDKDHKKPHRGLGYDLDEALIVASLPWHGGNVSAAIRAHQRDATPEHPRAWRLDPSDKQAVDNHADRIRGRTADIEHAMGQLPWETSSNWLGDLIEK